jgi:hypothetical protein
MRPDLGVDNSQSTEHIELSLLPLPLHAFITRCLGTRMWFVTYSRAFSVRRLYTVSWNGRITGDSRNGKKLEGSVRGLVQPLFRHLLRGTREKSRKT